MKLQEIASREMLPEYLNANDLLGLGVEIGVAFAGFSTHILSHWNGKRLFCVDPFEDQSKDVYREDTTGRNYEQWFRESSTRLMEFGGRGVVLREYSKQAAALFRKETFDFVYIDANHSEEAVTEDLSAWRPLVKRGGLLCGHDYHNSTERGNHCFVKKSVDRFIKAMGLNLVSCPGDPPNWYVTV